MPGNCADPAYACSKPPMKHSSSQHCVDCANAAARLPRNAGRALIWIYRHTLSPLVGYNCRHLPTCSLYGDEAIERFGLWGGGWMTLARLLRCQPWGTSGIDNVPSTTPPRARGGICRGDTDAGAASTRRRVDPRPPNRAASILPPQHSLGGGSPSSLQCFQAKGALLP